MNIDTILAARVARCMTSRRSITVGRGDATMHNERVSALVVSEDGATIDGIVSDRGLMNVLVEQGTAVLTRPRGRDDQRGVHLLAR